VYYYVSYAASANYPFHYRKSFVRRITSIRHTIYIYKCAYTLMHWCSSRRTREIQSSGNPLLFPSSGRPRPQLYTHKPNVGADGKPNAGDMTRTMCRNYYTRVGQSPVHCSGALDVVVRERIIICRFVCPFAVYNSVDVIIRTRVVVVVFVVALTSTMTTIFCRPFEILD